MFFYYRSFRRVVWHCAFTNSSYLAAKTMYVIGLDIGTGSTKAVAVDAAGKVLLTAQNPYPILNSVPHVSEQEPEVIWQAFVKCIHQLTTALKKPPAAICLS